MDFGGIFGDIFLIIPGAVCRWLYYIVKNKKRTFISIINEDNNYNIYYSIALIAIVSIIVLLYYKYIK